jgi:hypothetical protein
MCFLSPHCTYILLYSGLVQSTHIAHSLSVMRHVCVWSSNVGSKPPEIHMYVSMCISTGFVHNFSGFESQRRSAFPTYFQVSRQNLFVLTLLFFLIHSRNYFCANFSWWKRVILDSSATMQGRIFALVHPEATPPCHCQPWSWPNAVTRETENTNPRAEVLMRNRELITTEDTNSFAEVFV